jgi:PKD domain
MRGSLLSVLVAVVLAVAAPPVLAAPAWSAPVGVSLRGDQATDPALAVNARGDAVAVWGRDVSGQETVQASLRRAGETTWGPPIDLSQSATAQASAQVALDDAGDAVVVWRGRTNGQGVVQAARMSAASGVWESPVDVSTPGGGVSNVSVALDAHGDAVLVWARQALDGTETVQASARAVDGGSWSVPVDLSLAGRAGDTHVGMAADGLAIASWVRFDGTNWIAQYSVRAGLTTGWRSPINLSNGGPDIRSSDLVVDRAGNAVVVWRRGTGATTVVQARVRPRARDSWLPATDLARPGTDTSSLRLAVDARGDVTAVWAPALRSPSVVQSRRLPAGAAAWSPVVPVSPPDRVAVSPSIAVDPRGDAVVTWLRPVGDPTQDLWRVEAAARAATAGGFGPPGVVMADPVNDELSVGIDARGRAVAAAHWFNGAARSVRASILGAAGPALGALRVPAAGTLGRPTAFAVAPGDLWTPFAPTRWTFGDGASATGDRVAHVYRHRGRFRVRATATNALGESTTATRTIVIAAAPTLTRVAQSHRVWRRPGSSAHGRPRPVGTTFSLALDERARVRLAVSRVVRGRLVRRATIAFAGRAGVNRRRFAGRRLTPGRYVVAVTATDAAGRVSRTALLRFRIVR